MKRKSQLALRAKYLKDWTGRQKKLTLISFALLGLIGLALVIFAPVFAGGTTVAATIIFAGKKFEVADEDAEKFKGIIEGIEDTIKKNEAGYLTGAKATELINTLLKDYKKTADDAEIKTSLKELEDSLIKQGFVIESLKVQGGAKSENPKKAFFNLFKKQYDEKIDQVKATIKEGIVKFEFKATSVASSDFSAGSFQGFREILVEGTQPNEYEPITLIDTMAGGAGSNPLSWLERSVKSGAPAGILESEESPSMNFEWTEAEMNSRTISVLTVLSKRVANNYPMLENEVRNELMIAMRNELNRQIINGDGGAKEIKGILSYATALDLVANAETVEKCTEWDVLAKAWKQSRKAYKGSRPTAILVSIGTGVDMDLIKDDDSNYIMPMFMVNQDKTLKGVPIIECDDIAEREFLVGDFKRCLFNEVEGMTIELGYMNDQFGKRQYSMLMEMSGMQRVKSQFAGTFVKGNFDTAIAAINKVGA